MLVQYVPCYCRQQVVNTIAAFEEDGKESDPLFVTNDALSYEVKFTDGGARSKFHGPKWRKLINYYDLRYGDFITVDLFGEDLHHIGVSLMLAPSRGGHVPRAKPSVGMFCMLMHFFDFHDVVQV